MQFLFASGKIALKLKLSPIKLGLIVATVVGGIGAFVPEILGLGGRLLSNAGQYLIYSLVLFLIPKIFVSSLSIGFGVFGGLFACNLYRCGCGRHCR